MIASLLPPRHWRQPLVALSVLLLVIGVAYGHTLQAMVTIWTRSETYAHGFIVPLVVAWLVWRRRHELAPLQPRPTLLASGLMLGAGALWLAGDLVAVNTATQLAFVGMLVLAVPAVMGWQVTQALLFPLGFMFFAVPAGDFLMPQLMQWTADFTVNALRWTGIPVYREGLQFVIPSGTWSVIDACSGIRYLIASVTVGSLFAYLSYQSLRKRLLFVGVSVVVPLVANWVRAYLIVLLGHLSGNTLATGVDHIIYGWFFFGIVILAMFFIGARWADPTPAEAVSSAVAQPAAVQQRRGRVWVALVLALLVVGLPHGVNRVTQWGVHTQPVRLQPIAAQPPWTLSTAPVDGWTPAFGNPSATLNSVYASAEGATVGVYLAYYRQQSYERKLVSSENMLVRFQDEAWTNVGTGSTVVQLAGQSLVLSTAQLREQGQVLSHGARRLQVWRFYWVNDRFTANDKWAKLLGAWSRLTGKGDDGAIIVLYTPVRNGATGQPDGTAAESVLKRFLETHGPALTDTLIQIRAASHVGG